MYGRWEGEVWFHRRHMWSVPPPSTPSLVAPINSSVFIDSNSFSKDGRKIHVGDCALFIPPNDSPPFIGIIRRLIPDNDDNLTLSVNWLYRPSDVKLLKGASLEAAPNEVFYSFHQDEIPAASLLHPCKVAFLRKGVELPSMVSSFICRRVYDVETKKLWWLTDQDYINSFPTQERQEVVNKLLDKTQLEMYGGQNGPNGTTQVKGKKREHSSDSDMLKEEIAKITEKGGLVNLEGVEKIIQLMQPENGDKKVDLHSRILLVNVISVTDRFDLLGKFVQLKGLLILDEWLQEFHKGKIGDGLKEGDKEKSVEEFLFALLGALDKLPVNIHALQTCNVGKSVNHLRSHNNPEILKKARSLVDTWKKRVEDEMNMIERKRVEQMNGIETRSGTRRGGSGSWSNKSTVPEVSPNSLKQVKNFTSQTSSPKQEKQSPESPSPTKPPAPPGDVPAVTMKEDKSSSPIQSSKGSPNRIIVDSLVSSDGGEESKAAESASNGTVKIEKAYEDSYSSINALVESCANVSAPAASTSASVSETAVKLDFDLNEILPSDDIERPVSVTVAEPRKTREFRDFDLNVDIKGELDLNMNACDESPDVGPLTFPNNPQPSPLLFGGFDLNGPGPICYPTMPLGPTYRPYVMSPPGGPSNMGPHNRKYGSHGLDLNSGPNETLPLGLRQIPLDDEQLKMFQQMAASGGMLKRKEPVDGWDGDRLGYKHPSWQ